MSGNHLENSVTLGVTFGENSNDPFFAAAADSCSGVDC